MNIKDIRDNYSIDYTKNLVSSEELKLLEEKINCKFGPRLREYLLTYGYIGFESIEFYGINSRQLERSSLISKTIYLHKYFPKTIGFVAFENQGEGDYYLVDEPDKRFNYDSETDIFKEIKMNLLEYIINRLEEGV